MFGAVNVGTQGGTSTPNPAEGSIYVKPTEKSKGTEKGVMRDAERRKIMRVLWKGKIEKLEKIF